MTTLMTIVIGFLFAVGTFLMMRPHLMKFALGLLCFTNAANLLIFSAGRLTKAVPPIVAGDAGRDNVVMANPLSQALILTAIVIGFGFLAFTLVLLFRVSVDVGTVESRVVTETNEEV